MSEEVPKPNKSAGFQALLHLLWIIATIWDASKLYYSLVVILISAVVSYSIFETRRREDTDVQGQLFFFIVFWMALTFFTQSAGTVVISGFSIPVRYVDYIGLLVPITLWVIPSRSSEFFGRSTIRTDEVVKNFWKINLLYIIILKLFSTWTILEFLILIPMIVEPIYLYNRKKRPPILTLNIFEEIDRKYGSVRSLIGNIFFVQTAVIFGFLLSRFWALVILLLTVATFITGVISTVPIDKLESIGREENQKKKTAHEMGRHLREQLKKPQYNLNHILSTLKQEDLSKGYRVDTENLNFPSMDEDWRPPVGLILFPVDLGNYDYRREGETLLIGFNKIIPNFSRKASFSFSQGKGGNVGYSNNGDSTFMISGDQIKIGDLVFRMKTISVRTTDWEETIKNQLTQIDENVDISYTGFSSLAELQERMSAIGRKWMEFRQKAKEQAMNFIGGLLGADEAVFASVAEVKRLEAGEEEAEYLIEDDE